MSTPQSPATDKLSKELERFRIAYQTGLAGDIEPISKLAVSQGESLIACIRADAAELTSLRKLRDLLPERAKRAAQELCGAVTGYMGACMKRQREMDYEWAAGVILKHLRE